MPEPEKTDTPADVESRGYQRWLDNKCFGGGAVGAFPRYEKVRERLLAQGQVLHLQPR
jgi:hypothetical protein